MRRYLLTAIAGLSAGSAGAQSFDRTKAPKLSRPVPLVVPTESRATLANGIPVRTIEQQELPLVQVTAVIDGGVRLDGAHAGIATFVAGMLDEGAGSRDGAALQAELAYLGASLNTGAGWDSFSISLKVPTRSLGAALDLMADVLLRPTFSAAEVRRQRDLRLATVLQRRDEPNTLAGLAFNAVLFPESHPYHRPTGGDSASTAALDSSQVRAFYESAYRPERTTFLVVGAINAADAQRQLDQRFGAWRVTRPAAIVPMVTAQPLRPTSTRVYLVDKPNAAQSVIMIGWPGLDRRSPDYAAIEVMNTLLGGSFTSRLNMNLRENKGYSYGASSRFTYRRIPGPFVASSAVRTNVTDSSLVEFFKELRRVREQPVPAAELERAKAYVDLALPGTLEAISQVAGQMAELGTFGLSLTELPRFSAAVRRVTASDVQRVARKYLTPDRAMVVVVGDLAKVRDPIAALKLGAITTLDAASVAR